MLWLLLLLQSLTKGIGVLGVCANLRYHLMIIPSTDINLGRSSRNKREEKMKDNPETKHPGYGNEESRCASGLRSYEIRMTNQ